MRGGTSKGPFFDLRDLPSDEQELAEVLLRIMGSPDSKQIDGLGGAKTVTSKVVMVQPSDRPDVDVDYLFAQVFIAEGIVDFKPTCGNMMSGVGPFAIEKGWVKPSNKSTAVQVYNINTKSHAEMIVQTPGGDLAYNGDFRIDGVPGSGSPIVMRMRGIEGGATGRLFPTGNVIDDVRGMQLTMFDAGNLMIHLRASDFGLTGNEVGNYFESQREIMEEIENIRLEIARRAGMGDVSNSVLPKVGLLSAPKNDGHLRSLYFTPKTFHPTHAISGAVCVMASSRCQGTIAAQLIPEQFIKEEKAILEHQSGIIPVDLKTSGQGKDFKIHFAGTYRTARKIMEGKVFY